MDNPSQAPPGAQGAQREPQGGQVSTGTGVGERYAAAIAEAIEMSRLLGENEEQQKGAGRAGALLAESAYAEKLARERATKCAGVTARF